MKFHGIFKWFWVYVHVSTSMKIPLHENTITWKYHYMKIPLHENTITWVEGKIFSWHFLLVVQSCPPEMKPRPLETMLNWDSLRSTKRFNQIPSSDILWGAQHSRKPLQHNKSHIPQVTEKLNKAIDTAGVNNRHKVALVNNHSYHGYLMVCVFHRFLLIRTTLINYWHWKLIGVTFFKYINSIFRHRACLIPYKALNLVAKECLP